MAKRQSPRPTVRGKTTLIDDRISKPANRSGMQQSFVPGSGGGEGHYKKMGNGRGKNLS